MMRAGSLLMLVDLATLDMDENLYLFVVRFHSPLQMIRRCDPANHAHSSVQRHDGLEVVRLGDGYVDDVAPIMTERLGGAQHARDEIGIASHPLLDDGACR